MTFTLRAVEDDFITMGSEDAKDVGRVLRMLGIQWDAPHRRNPVVSVTIHAALLTEDELHAKIPSTQGDDSSDTLELFDGTELPF